MPKTGFEPAIPATHQPQTIALDRSATGIGPYINDCNEYLIDTLHQVNQTATAEVFVLQHSHSQK
jgi:hypothetical protein